TCISWPACSPASTSRRVEYRFLLRDRIAIFIQFQSGFVTVAAKQERSARINHQAIHCRTSQQHAETHRVTIREGHLDRPATPAKLDLRRDHHPFLAV